MTASPPEPCRSGFYGKLPSRGDFIRHGLPSSFVRPLDQWWQVVLSEGRALLGEAWNGLWMEAPVWCFRLPSGCCGPHAAVGFWLPSIDRSGRLFPLTVALVAPDWATVAPFEASFLQAAEPLALLALEHDHSPDMLAAALDAIPLLPATAPPEPATALWTTTGSPHVRPTSFTSGAMPDGPRFATMLRDAESHA